MEMRIETICLHCHAMYLYVMDTVKIEEDEVQFLACFSCMKGYTRWGKKMELIK